MAKLKTRYVCSECGYETTRWLGKCPACDQWNTLTETHIEAEPDAVAGKKLKQARGSGAEPVLLSEIVEEDNPRVLSGVGELDRVLGGGIVPGSLTLVGGEPGIGKSTLLLQVASNLAGKGLRVLYVSGEESARQIKLRAQRLELPLGSLLMLAENDICNVMDQVERVQPDFVVVDSIQTMYRPDMASAPGSVPQVRESAALLMRAAKGSGCSIFVVGHVTKEGAIAGPRVLEHMVDCVLYFEGERQNHYRVLRAVKNRFGSINEIGLFEMRRRGMIEVPNPSEMLLSQRAHGQSGSVVLCALEGTRPVLVDVQALVAPTTLGYPRRMASGVDQGRLALLLAVLEKRAGLAMYNQDVYINIAGGLTLDEPACDLALMVAVASAARNIPIDESFAVMGEVGLAGEVRAVSQAQRRINECARLGLKSIVLPRSSLRTLKLPEGVRAYGVETVSEALRTALIAKE
ncbi:MAG: DNA repair protein RadA [Candidatus Fimadaptatus sp.]